jgi:hypothetical protein
VVRPESISSSDRDTFALRKQKNVEQGILNFEGEVFVGCHQKAREATTTGGTRITVFSRLDAM